MMLRCTTCRDEGWDASGMDACGDCARRAERQWLLVHGARANRRGAAATTQLPARRTAPARAMEAEHGVC